MGSLHVVLAANVGQAFLPAAGIPAGLGPFTRSPPHPRCASSDPLLVVLALALAEKRKADPVAFAAAGPAVAWRWDMQEGSDFGGLGGLAHRSQMRQRFR